MDITTQLTDFQTRQQAINASVELSQEGKRRALQNLTAEINKARPVIVRELKTQWDALKTKGGRNIEQVKQAQAAAAQAWDYSRLEYMARSVKHTIANTENIDDVIGQYNQVKESGDTHAARAWAETAGEAIKAKYRNGQAVTFTKQLAQDLRDLIETPKVKELQAQGSELTKQAVLLDQATDRAQKFFNPENRGVFALPDEFTEMRAGVSIAQKYVPETLAIESTVTIV